MQSLVRDGARMIAVVLRFLPRASNQTPARNRQYNLQKSPWQSMLSGIKH